MTDSVAQRPGPPGSPAQGDPVAELQAILDRSARTAGQVHGWVFGRAPWRLAAPDFVTLWNQTRVCVMATASTHGTPHQAVVHCVFEGGTLTMRLWEKTARERDILQNPKVVLTKATPDGAVMTVYGTARVIPWGWAPGRTPESPTSKELHIDIERAYGLKPAPVRSAQFKEAEARGDRSAAG